MSRVLKRHRDVDVVVVRRYFHLVLEFQTGKVAVWPLGPLVHYNNACKRFAEMLRLVALLAVCAVVGSLLRASRGTGSSQTGKQARHGNKVWSGVQHLALEISHSLEAQRLSW